MKLPKFDHARARWDAWRAFHINHMGVEWHSGVAPVVQFDTGELILTAACASHKLRGSVTDLNIQTISSTDPKLPQLVLPDGTPVRRSWLDYKVTNLLIDHDNGRVHKLDSRHHDLDTTHIPKRFRGKVLAYFPGEGCPAIGQPVTVYRPRSWTKEQKDQVRALQAQCRMWMELNDLSWVDDQGDPKYSLRGVNAKGEVVPVYNSATCTITDTLKMSFEDMSQAERIRLAGGKLVAGLYSVTYPYLMLASAYKEMNR